MLINLWIKYFYCINMFIYFFLQIKKKKIKYLRRIDFFVVITKKLQTQSCSLTAGFVKLPDSSKQ